MLMKIYYVQYMVYLTSQKAKDMIVVVISFEKQTNICCKEYMLFISEYSFHSCFSFGNVCITWLQSEL